MKKSNGYICVCRLVNIMLDGYSLGWKQLCVDVGPTCWDKLSLDEKQWFKQLIQCYKQTPAGIAEQNGWLPSQYQFMDAVFTSDDEVDFARNLLQPAVDLLSSD